MTSRVVTTLPGREESLDTSLGEYGEFPLLNLEIHLYSIKKTRKGRRTRRRGRRIQRGGGGRRDGVQDMSVKGKGDTQKMSVEGRVRERSEGVKTKDRSESTRGGHLSPTDDK